MSWYELIGICAEGRALAADERARGPLSCPNDGEPLIDGPDGRRFCRFDGWRPEHGDGLIPEP